MLSMVVAKSKVELPSLRSIRTLVGSVESSYASRVWSRAFYQENFAEISCHDILPMIGLRGKTVWTQRLGH